MAKNLQIALIILLVFIGLFLLNKSSQSKHKSSTEAIFSNDPEDIFKFLIQNGEQAIELARVDTIWRISGNDTLEIKPQSMDNLFEKVLKVNKSTIISENPEKYSKYSIDDSTGTHLAVIGFNGETVGYYVFGRSKSDYSRSYVRIGDDPNVYLADQNVTYMLNTRETFWGEKPKEEIPPQLPVDIPADTTAIK